MDFIIVHLLVLQKLYCIKMYGKNDVKARKICHFFGGERGMKTELAS